ncbi:hypothetical protein HYV50_00640 [Candidatus Pacearchaeota archaeon]|nr:hypothetical protein [Candidatus Pacearchaeota archaeon]
MNHKRNYLLIGALLFVIIFVSYVESAGVATSYWEGYELKMAPGETREVSMRLQNMVGSEDLTFRAELKEGGEIAVLTDENLDYLVPLGRNDVRVNLRITIPQDAKFGDKYNVRVLFREIKSGEGKTVEFATAVEGSFPVLIVGEGEQSLQESPTTGQITAESGAKGKIAIILLIIAGVIVIIYLIIKKRKKTEDKKSSKTKAEKKF